MRPLIRARAERALELQRSYPQQRLLEVATTMPNLRQWFLLLVPHPHLVRMGWGETVTGTEHAPIH